MEDNIIVNILTTKPDMAEMPGETSHPEKLMFQNGCCLNENKTFDNNNIYFAGYLLLKK